MVSVVTAKEYPDPASVCDRVRQLVGGCPAFREQLVNSLENFKQYLQRQSENERVRQQRMRAQAKLVLATGCIVEPGICGEGDCYFVEGWVYPDAIRQVEREWENALIAKSPEAAKHAATLAACLLASLQKQDGEKFDPKALQLAREQWRGDGLHTDYTPIITLRARSEFYVLPRIGCLSQRDSATALAELARRSSDDYRVVAFHHLRALADLGTTLPLIPKPLPLDDDASDEEKNERFWGTVAHLHASYPVSHDAAHHPETAEPDERYLPMRIARDFLQVAEGWVEEHKSRMEIAAKPRSSKRGETPRWKKVAVQLLKLRAKPGARYTTTRELANQLGSTESTVRKAIKNTLALKAWAEQARAMRSVAKVQRIGGVVEDSKPSTRESNPATNAEKNDDLQRLIDEQRADDRQSRARPR